MSTKTITESIVSTISKGPLIIFLLIGLGVWQASNSTQEQREAIKQIIELLNNQVGLFVYIFVMSLFMYSLILWPVGKFFADVSKEFLESSKLHEENALTHHEASKQMYHVITELKESCAELTEKIHKFYDNP